MTVISQGLPSCGLALVRAPRHLGEGHYVSLRPHDLTWLDNPDLLMSVPLCRPQSPWLCPLPGAGAGAGASPAPRPGSQLAPCLTGRTVSIPFTVWRSLCFLSRPGVPQAHTQNNTPRHRLLTCLSLRQGSDGSTPSRDRGAAA